MHIRALAAGDAPRYRELMLEAYTTAADAFTSTAEERAARPETWWVERIGGADAPSAAFGAFEDGELVATVAIEYSTARKKRHCALLVGMYVRPQARARGIASALLRAAIAHAQGRSGLKLVQLTLTEGNESALRLYRAAGFRAWGTEPMAIHTPGGYKGKVHMWFPLAQEAEPSAPGREAAQTDLELRHDRVALPSDGTPPDPSRKSAR